MKVATNQKHDPDPEGPRRRKVGTGFLKKIPLKQKVNAA
jgi:hypothetical protein